MSLVTMDFARLTRGGVVRADLKHHGCRMSVLRSQVPENEPQTHGDGFGAHFSGKWCRTRDVMFRREDREKWSELEEHQLGFKGLRGNS
jgi:hypothetical protein